MTLILNEIHAIDGFKNTLMIAAADRRITKDGRYYATCQKIFKIDYLNGAISYFGIASCTTGGKQTLLSDWLPNFIRRNSDSNNLQVFVSRLKKEIERIIPKEKLNKYPSGFHICAYQKDGLPDFWFLSNIGPMNGFKYTCYDHYNEPESQFLKKDAIKNFEWDGKNLKSVKSGVIQIYRNGDFRMHVAAWEKLDSIFKMVQNFPDFNSPKSPEEYRDYVKFKFEVIAYFYKKWAKKEIIARPIDVLVLQPNK